jgi:fused signal recognition particle receptor
MSAMFWRRTKGEPAPGTQTPGESEAPAPDTEAATRPGEQLPDDGGGTVPGAPGAGAATRPGEQLPDDGEGGADADATTPRGSTAMPRPGALWGPGIGPEPAPVAPGPASAGEQQGATIADGVAASRRGFMARLHGILGAGSASEETWEEVEETLIAGDVGARLAMDVVARARSRRDAGGPEAAVRAELARLLPAGSAGPWRPARPRPDLPAVVLVVGVNGTGKTTSIAKIAARLAAEGDSVILAAADTFRAAAIEQLETWAGRLGLPVVAHKAGADPSAVVFDALDAAVARGADVVIVDTAGRLHTRHNLMEELAKIRRTIDKRLPGVSPDVLFVLDATTGQNGLAQAKAFHETSGLTGLVLTKLDSTAKGGIVFAIEQALGVPVVFAGVGERVSDLVDFDPAAFVEALFS